MPTRREIDLQRENDIKEMKSDIKNLIEAVNKLIEKVEDSQLKKVAAKKK